MAKIAGITNFQNSTFTKREGQEGLCEVRIKTEFKLFVYVISIHYISLDYHDYGTQ